MKKMSYAAAEAKLKEYGQDHVLDGYHRLGDRDQDILLNQISDTDFSVIENSRNNMNNNDKGVISPISVMQVSEIESMADRYTATGIAAVKSGKVGAVLLAGGMGTRLGSDNPKGMYDIGLTRHVYIFQRLIENLMDVVNASETYIHLFVMTSEKNNDATIKFFKEQNYFDYPADYVHFFIQDMAPATDYDGKVYMESRGRIATSPNGNGGWYRSMEKAGLDKFLADKGIEWLNVFAVDNVLQRIADPCFVGATIENKCVCGAKVIRKADREEKVGVLCLENNHPSIVEYYELTEEMKDEMDANGEPAYNYGVILNYLFHVKELNDIAAMRLPLHVVEKKIPHIDREGKMINPDKPNGYKYETLILDMIKLLDSCCAYEVVREKEFAPIKNMTGVDSVESARELLGKNNIEL